MIFNSLDFLLFFPFVWLVFYFLKNQNQKANWLLISSLFFYGYWKPEYLILLTLTSTIDYFSALYIQKSESRRARKIGLLASIVSNLSILILFKYSHFLASNLNLAGWLNETPAWLNLVLPVGISFYTFQAMAYVIDVYRKRLPAEKSFSRFLLFITFFPQLVAGPIERAPHLMVQLTRLKAATSEKIIPALWLICMGLWKKVFIADRLGVFVDGVFNNIPESNGIQCLLAIFFFGIQIYCDFSGYSDIARGIARFFGVNLMLNFNNPYLATSLTDFWRRWHISLSGWFRDYVYHPLGGGRNGYSRTFVNILIVFLLSGIWHGANWTFLMWGLWHGLGLVLERVFGMVKNRAIPYRLATLFWIFAGWTFFRINSIYDLDLFLQKIQEFDWSGFQQFNLFRSNWEFLLAALGIVSLLMIEKYQTLRFRWYSRLSQNQRMAWITTMFLMLIWLGKFKGQDFIYFQF